MKELLLIGVAILAGIATFTVITKRSGGDCIP
jgi:hypothetical protein